MLETSITQEIDGILAEADVHEKLRRAELLTRARGVGMAAASSGTLRTGGAPARPSDWRVVAVRDVPERPDLTQARGRYLLMHSVAHIEVSAVELALMAVADFPNEEPAYYRDMLHIAAEEVEHARLLIAHLREMGGELGSDPVHLGLYAAAHVCMTLPERLAVVPRILEAKGLDVSLGLTRRLAGAGDRESAACLERIYRDEIGHVAIGTKWFRAACAKSGLNSEQYFMSVAERFRSRRRPLDRAGRLRSGFTERELHFLESGALESPAPNLYHGTNVP